MNDDVMYSKLVKGLIVFSILFVGLFYFAYYAEGFIGVYIMFASFVVGLILLVITFASIVALIQSRKKDLLISLFAPILAFIIVFHSPIERLIENFKSPVMLYGYCEHTVTELSLKLRKDWSFEYNAGAFLKREIYYGNYDLVGDTIVLQFDEAPYADMKNKLIINDISFIEIGDSLEHLHNFKILENKFELE